LLDELFEYLAKPSRLTEAIRTLFRFMIRITFVHGQRKEDLAGPAWPDFKIGNPLFIDVGRQKEFAWIVSDGCPIAEFDECKPVIKDFKHGFLAFAVEHMAKHEDRLPLPFDAEIFQRTMSRGRARKLAGGTRSNPRHRLTYSK
jgi:hypothetical protein